MNREESFIRVGGIVILTPDADKSLEVFKSYGFAGPWRQFINNSDNVADLKLNGEPTDVLDAKIYMCDYGEITIELFEPHDPESSFYKDLQAMGKPFVHHIIMRSRPAFYDVIKEKGIEEHMSAYFPPIGETARWFGTAHDLGFDIYAWDPNEGNKTRKYPDDYVISGAYDMNK